MNIKNVLIVSNRHHLKGVIKQALNNKCTVDKVETLDDAMRFASEKSFDLVFIDINAFEENATTEFYKKSIDSFKHFCPNIETIIIATDEKFRETVNAVKCGATDYINYPLNIEEIKLILYSIEKQTRVQFELDYLRNEFRQTDAVDIFKTNSNIMKDVYNQIRSVAPTKTTVLLIGETGTGKGVLANLIHLYSRRAGEQFVSVHCGAIPDTLTESELFGHEKGAFSGAIKRKLGKFEIASKGTIFLDEIGTITPSVQVKFLQVLQDGRFYRVGGEDFVKTDTRVVAATNSDLKKMSDDGLFRKDLFYRLNVFAIQIPPLRERMEDIPLFLDHFTRKFNISMQKQIQSAHPEVLKAMNAYSWPGNIRELENIIERAFILESSSMLTPESFPSEFFLSDTRPAMLPVDTTLHLAEARRRAIEDFERQFIKEVLTKTAGKINKSAEIAGISTRQFHKLMVRYQIRKEDFKGK